MAHFMIEFAGTQAAFPGGEPRNPVAIHFQGQLHSPTGQVIPTTEGKSLLDFCAMLGLKVKDSKPLREQEAFLADWVQAHYPDAVVAEPAPLKGRKPKRKVEASTPPKKAEPKPTSPEQLQERAVLGILKAAHPHREEGRGHGRDNGRDHGSNRGGRNDRGPKTLIFQVEDKHGKMAEAQYKGKGQFEPFVPREENGTKTVARNKWAARMFFDHYGAALAALPEETGGN